MNICIYGGGHIGTTLACYIKHYNSRLHVSILTRNPHSFSNKIKCNDWEKGYSYESVIDCVSDDPSRSAKNADIVFVALPHFAVEHAFSQIAPYVSQRAFVGVLPGGGGCEFYFKKYFDVSHTLFGFQRVPFTAKLEEYGHETNLKSWKPYSIVGTLDSSRVFDACELIELCGLKVKQAPNFLSIALTPTNPILHTSRTYELFSNHDQFFIYPEKYKFYVGWTDETSATMISMDNELHHLLDKITEIDTSVILPLTEHYQANTINEMTKKINSIPTFQSVFAPMTLHHSGKGYIADLTSRMFTEDFPWGLAIIRSYFDIFNMNAKTMDKLLSWYSKFMGYEWYVHGKFCGRDLINSGIIQNYGVSNIGDLMRIYCM